MTKFGFELQVVLVMKTMLSLGIVVLSQPLKNKKDIYARTLGHVEMFTIFNFLICILILATPPMYLFAIITFPFLKTHMCISSNDGVVLPHNITRAPPNVSFVLGK
jgi:hypothetical protein